ncbi:DOMON domain-containing protein [Zavarzinella formosa]|uniref:hypothetical protein n=1 Tax=Zavarzinella formosa TaxID=360055 RepID=UPI0003134C2C|nr:hypothetical protein [Zavarzinella formosa]
MAILPYRFLTRTLYSVPYVKDLPGTDDEGLPELPLSGRLDSLSDIDEAKPFAEVRLAWNEFGLAVCVTVKGKENHPIGDKDRPRQSDGVSLWIDTRGDRSSHRATRTCHQFHLLAAGGGSNKDEPCVVQTKINRALQDAPLASVADIPFHCERIKGGYRIEAFFNASVLTGYDPEQYPRLGMFYSVRDFELGEQTPGVTGDFPFGEDPSLWGTLELVKAK